MNCPEETNLECKLVVARCWKWGNEEWLPKGTVFFFPALKKMDSGYPICEYNKTTELVTFTCVICILCQLHLNKAVNQKGKKVYWSQF